MAEIGRLGTPHRVQARAAGQVMRLGEGVNKKVDQLRQWRRVVPAIQGVQLGLVTFMVTALAISREKPTRFCWHGIRN